MTSKLFTQTKKKHGVNRTVKAYKIINWIKTKASKKQFLRQSLKPIRVLEGPASIAPKNLISRLRFCSKYLQTSMHRLAKTKRKRRSMLQVSIGTKFTSGSSIRSKSMPIKESQSKSIICLFSAFRKEKKTLSHLSLR